MRVCMYVSSITGTYKHYKFPPDGMRIDVIRYEPCTLCLRPFNFFSNSFIDLYSYEVVSSSDMRKNEA